LGLPDVSTVVSVCELKRCPSDHPETSPGRRSLAPSPSRRGHALTIDHGWKDVADAALRWLAAQEL
jgi:hypothetical protein